MKKEILAIVVETVKEIGEENENKDLMSPAPKTQLYGPQGNLNSLDLVRLVSDIEIKISSRLNKSITIASEKAMSRNNSPFSTIEHLTDFIIELLESNS